MTKIWKWFIPIEGDFTTIEMPVNAEILCVQTQGNLIVIWAMCNDYLPREKRHFEVIGTGHTIYDTNEDLERKYIGTVQISRFVWHVFERVTT